jgi:hypothetical protein
MKCWVSSRVNILCRQWDHTVKYSHCWLGLEKTFACLHWGEWCTYHPCQNSNTYYGSTCTGDPALWHFQMLLIILGFNFLWIFFLNSIVQTSTQKIFTGSYTETVQLNLYHHFPKIHYYIKLPSPSLISIHFPVWANVCTIISYLNWLS